MWRKARRKPEKSCIRTETRSVASMKQKNRTPISFWKWWWRLLIWIWYILKLITFFSIEMTSFGQWFGPKTRLLQAIYYRLFTTGHSGLQQAYYRPLQAYYRPYGLLQPMAYYRPFTTGHSEEWRRRGLRSPVLKWGTKKIRSSPLKYTESQMKNDVAMHMIVSRKYEM